MPNLPLPESLHNLLVFNDDWGTYRGVAWRAAFGTWADGSLLRKIVGIGPGMMHTAVAAWAGDAMTARMATFYAAHNEYLEQLLTTGILGLAAWLLLVAAHLRRGERSWNTPAWPQSCWRCAAIWHRRWYPSGYPWCFRWLCCCSVRWRP